MKVQQQLIDAGIDPALLPPGTLVNGRPVAEADSKPAECVTVEACSSRVRIVVPGPAMGKPRMTRQDKWMKRPPVVRYREWCNWVMAAVGDSLPAAEKVVELNWTAYFEPPKRWSKKRRAEAIGNRHTVKPDRDNIDKAILDCLYPGGDAAVACGRIEKRWAWSARLEIEVLT